MEPRIATLLEGSPPVPLALSWPPPAPPKPHPVEPTTANDHVRAKTVLLEQRQCQRQSPAHDVAPQRQKPSAPIASVLNTVTPFSGRLSDLLLDPTQQAPKRKRSDEPAEPPPPAGPEHALLTLPKPHQQPKKSAKRPRIPPLLQGLHQVPPQAQSRLFPPITSESGAFGRDLGDGPALRTTSGAERAKKQCGAPEHRATATQVYALAASVGDKENRAAAHLSPAMAAAPVAPVTKELRKRNKWSEQETRDLLLGVSRFGIGSWKKILQCSDFTFNQRTAVDLKDRFRTCCPGEGLKARKPKPNGDTHPDGSLTTTALSNMTTLSSNPDPVVHKSLDTINSLRKHRGDTHRKGPAELREMGIHVSFARSNRRERRPFTEQDDENLLKGFKKYASSWHLIRDDKDLGFSTRQPTDLRDRFRIRYPEKFAKAGYKLKPKEEAMLKEKEKGMLKETLNSQPSVNSQDSSSSSRAKASGSDTSFSSLASTASSHSNRMPLALRESFLTSFTGPLDDFGDLDSEADGDHIRSPIILNRNIFEWADANPSQMNAVSTASLPSMGPLASDAPLGILNATDVTHINPMGTLDLPMALLNSNVHSSTASQPSSQHATTSRLPDPYHHPNSSTAVGNSTTNIKHRTDPVLRTPNLPTIVFPHVPASSARSAVHNLPPPTDLLSGLEIDPRLEVQSFPFMTDEGLGFASTSTFYTSGTTLAPMNIMPTREMLTPEKGLLQEPGRGG